MVNIQLTDEQYKTLCNALLNAQDEGPGQTGEGWKSDAIEALIKSIEVQASTSYVSSIQRFVQHLRERAKYTENSDRTDLMNEIADDIESGFYN